MPAKGVRMKVSPGRRNRLQGDTNHAQIALHQRKVELHFIDPEQPTRNCYIESFNGSFRDECRDEHAFVSLSEALKARPFEVTRPDAADNPFQATVRDPNDPRRDEPRVKTL